MDFSANVAFFSACDCYVEVDDHQLSVTVLFLDWKTYKFSSFMSFFPKFLLNQGPA